MKKNIEQAGGHSEIVLYQTDDQKTRVEVRLDDGTVWLSQKMLSDLYQKDIRTINEHLQNIYEDRELEPWATIRKFRIVQKEGVREVARVVDFYNLDAILAVGYRVRSSRGTQFRRWATEHLKEYLVKGFVLDDERLKNPPGPGVPDYFDELLERIRDIRASEQRVYLRVREILALVADYDPNDADTQEFFQIVQNKLHFAATGKTAPELIAGRADHAKPNMGLTVWKGAVVRKADVLIAKNYLNEEEIQGLNRIVTMFLDYAEDQARMRKQVFIKDWREQLDAFLRFHHRNVLVSPGKVSREDADRIAQEQYVLFEKRRISQVEDESAKQLEASVKALNFSKSQPIKKRRPEKK
ncbi:MAG: virulence RhuM family protein [Candidatus Omnitrophica bacterium]|nr:virulence RhuM family protein [Candidatus Omnitrophota bacterium]